MGAQPAAFFLLAVAYSIGWNAISSELARFADAFGPDVLLKLSLAYYIPSVPLLVAAAWLDERVDAWVGRARAHLFRAVAGFGGCTAILAAFPYLQHSLPQLLASVSALGVASSVAFSCSYQLANGCGESSTVALTLGFVASAPVVLAVEAALRVGPCCAFTQMLGLYSATAAVAAAGLAAAVALARSGRRRVLSWRAHQQREAQPQLSGDDGGGDLLRGVRQPLLLPPPGGSVDGTEERGDAALAVRAMMALGAGDAACASFGVGALSRQLSVATAAESDALSYAGDGEAPLLLPAGDSRGGGPPLVAAWPAALALFLGVGSSMFLFPFLTHFPARQLGMMLPVVLFWVRCFSDIAGRLLPKACGAPPSAPALLALSALRVALLPFALLYIHRLLPAWLCSDWVLVAYVALMWLSSGAVNVWAYLLLPRLVPPALLSRATSAMTLTFNAACLAGLLLAIPFSQSTVVSSAPSPET